jgi:hypothetical protein
VLEVGIVFQVPTPSALPHTWTLKWVYKELGSATDELFLGRNHEDVNDWAKRLTMVTEMGDLNVDKLFKFAKLNLKGKVKKWFRRL